MSAELGDILQEHPVRRVQVGGCLRARREFLQVCYVSNKNKFKLSNFTFPPIAGKNHFYIVFTHVVHRRLWALTGTPQVSASGGGGHGSGGKGDGVGGGKGSKQSQVRKPNKRSLSFFSCIFRLG